MRIVTGVNEELEVLPQLRGPYRPGMPSGRVFFRNLSPPNWFRFDGGMADLLLAVVRGTDEHAELLIGPTPGTANWTITGDWDRGLNL
jgi:hypothetical protein